MPYHCKTGKYCTPICCHGFKKEITTIIISIIIMNEMQEQNKGQWVGNQVQHISFMLHTGTKVNCIVIALFK